MKTVCVAVLSMTGLCAQATRVPASQKKTPASTDRSQVVYRWDVQQSGVEDDLTGVSFANLQVGYAVGKSNTILKTKDGGNTWNRLLERQDRVDFQSVMFISPTDGWVESSTLLHTSDGGESWQPAVPLPGPAGFGGGSMLGTSRLQLHVRGMGAGVFRSDDGGRTWKSLGEPPSNAFETVFLVDDQHGWVAGDYGLLASTTDGGATWKEQNFGFKPHITKIQFVSPQVGWLLPHRGHQGGLLATADGGQTWTSQYAGIAGYSPLADMQFLNAQAGFLLAEGNHDHLVLATGNGGKNWRTIGHIRQYSTALSFPASDEGWVVGPKGYIVHYHKVVQ